MEGVGVKPRVAVRMWDSLKSVDLTVVSYLAPNQVNLFCHFQNVLIIFEIKVKTRFEKNISLITHRIQSSF